MGQGIMTNYGQRSESFWIRESLEYIIDAGQGEKGRNIVRNYSRHDHFNQFRGINCFVISHGDSDHISLARDIVRYLNPQIIVISPLVYAINKYRYTVQDKYRYTGQDILEYPNPNNLPDSFFSDSEDYYITENLDQYSLENPAPAVYISRRNVNTFPWDSDIPQTSVPEFETYITRSSIEYANLINNFVNQIRRSTNITEIKDILRSDEFLSNLCKGIILDRYDTPEQYMQLYLEIESRILKLIKNDMSLICRVGKTIFTGDANREQLNEVTEILTQRARELNHNLTIKINHHGSPTNAYQNIDFYLSLSPRQLLLKRDDRVENASGFYQYREQLNSCPRCSRFIDSNNMNTAVAIPFTT